MTGIPPDLYTAQYLINDLRREIKTQNVYIQFLETDKDELNKQNEELSRRVDALAVDKATLAERNRKLTGRVDALASRLWRATAKPLSPVLGGRPSPSPPVQIRGVQD
jgi:predicted nuclease with TOPRIM domain